MKSIWMKTIVILFITKQIQSGLLDKKSLSNDFITSCPYSNCSFTPNGHFRFRRQGQDPLDTTIDRMQTIARLTNAIYLQQGLLDESVLPYDVIAELLFLGDVKQEALNDPGIEKVFEEIKALPNKLVHEPGVTSSETIYEILHEMKKEIQGVTSVTEWKEKADFESDLKKLETDGLKFKSLEALTKVVGSLKAFKDKFDDQANSKHFGAFFNTIVLDLEKIAPKSEELLKNIDNMVKLPSGKNASSTFLDVYQISKATNFFAHMKSSTSFIIKADYHSKVAQNMIHVSETSKSVGTISLFVDAIHNILLARKTPNPRRMLKQTSGFPNGLEDFSLLSGMHLDRWLTKLIDSKTLEKSLDPIQPFNDYVTKMSSELGEIQSQKPIPIEKIHRFVKSLVPMAQTSGDVKKLTTDVLACFTSQYTSGDYYIVDLDSIRGNVTLIDTTMETMKTSMKKASEYFKTAEVVKTLELMKKIATNGNTDDANELNSAVKEFTEPTTMAKFNKMFTDFEPILEPLKLQGLKTLAGQIQKMLKGIDKFYTTWDGLKTLLSCIQSFDFNNMHAVNEMIQMSKNLQIGDPYEAEMAQVVKLAGTLEKVKSTGDVIDAMKATQNDESKALAALAALDTPDKHSETLGSATRGIVNFRDVIAQKPDFVIIQTHLQSVDDKLKLDLSKFQTMSDALDAWKTTVTLPDSQKLEDFSKTFLDAKSISGIDDVKRIRDDVEKLQKSSTDPGNQKSLGELKKALDELNSIGLDFVRYQQSFGDSEDSLKALDLFFAKWRGILNPTTPDMVNQTPDPQIKTSSEASTIESTTAAEGWFEYFLKYGPYGFVSAAIFFGLACVCYKFYYGKWLCELCKKEEEPITDAEKKKLLKETKTEQPEVTEAQLLVPPRDPRDADDIRDAKQTKAAKRKTKEDRKLKLERLAIATEIAHATAKALRDEAHMRAQLARALEPPNPNVILEVPMLCVDACEKYVQALHQKLYRFQQRGKTEVTRLQAKTLQLFIEEMCDAIRRITSTVMLNARSAQNRFNYQLQDESQILLDRRLCPRFYYKDYYYNGNWLKMPNNAKFFMLETPLVASVDSPLRTDDKFLCFLAQIKVDAVVFIGHTSELNGILTIRDDKLKVRKNELNYGNYFPKEKDEKKLFVNPENQIEMTFECREKVELIPGVLIKRRLAIKYESGEVYKPRFDEEQVPRSTIESTTSEFLDGLTPAQRKEHEKVTASEREEQRRQDKDEELKNYKEECDQREKAEQMCTNFHPEDFKVIFSHYQLMDWPVNGNPQNTNAVRRVLEEIAGKKKVVVHCTDGVQRTGAFVLTELARQDLSYRMSQQPSSLNVEYHELLIVLRNARNGAVDKDIHMAFVMKTIVDYAKAQDDAQGVQSSFLYYNSFNNCYNAMVENYLKKEVVIDMTSLDGTQSMRSVDDTQSSWKSFKRFINPFK